MNYFNTINKLFSSITLIIFTISASLFTGCCEIPEITGCDECFQSPDAGNCEAAIPKYFFNSETESCEMFVWGGCDGIVPFQTLEECENCACNQSN